MIVLQGGKLRAVMGGSGGPLIVSAVYQTLVRFAGGSWVCTQHQHSSGSKTH
jgi:gamma-glutamyltranspeptidase